VAPRTLADLPTAAVEPAVAKALLKLPPAQRQAYVLSQQGLPTAAVAEQLGVPEAAAAALIRIAGQRLEQLTEVPPAAWEEALRHVVAEGTPSEALDAVRKAVMGRGAPVVGRVLGTTVPALRARMDYLSRMRPPKSR